LLDGSSVLLHAGGWGDQPYWLIQALMIYKEEKARQLKIKQGKS
jgi:hypothetical protein